MTLVRITVESYRFIARLEEDAAPETCAAFVRLLPWRRTLLQARWSGHATFVPLDDFALGVGYENATSYPAAGELLFHTPEGNAEILFPYGGTCFASPRGQQAGNHFLTVVEGRDQLQELGRFVHWHGAQEIVFERA